MAAVDSVIAQQGDALDALIWRTRGLSIADVPAVLALNPGLAALGTILPLGTVVAVPTTPPVATSVDIVNLWD